MFQDEAAFGRINKTKACWITGKNRPSMPWHHVRDYRYAYGALDPLDGKNFFIIVPQYNSDLHNSSTLVTPDNIELAFIPPNTPEMNLIKQVWAELRKSFANRLFPSSEKVIDKLFVTINELTNETVKNITGREWILTMF